MHHIGTAQGGNTVLQFCETRSIGDGQ